MESIIKSYISDPSQLYLYLRNLEYNESVDQAQINTEIEKLNLNQWICDTEINDPNFIRLLYTGMIDHSVPNKINANEADGTGTI